MNNWMSKHRGLLTTPLAVGIILGWGSCAFAEEPRYSFFEVQFTGQSLDRKGVQDQPEFQQSVQVETDSGEGITFSAGLGLWKNFYLYGDFVSTDIDDDAVITNQDPDSPFRAGDEFDLTTLRGGLGYRYQLNFTTDIVAQAGYESVDLDFGSFAGENFDSDDKGFGALLGLRTIIRDRLELHAHGRYSDVGDPEIGANEFDSDILFGGGIGYRLVRGLWVRGDYETGEIDTWAIGFRLDLSED